MKSAGQGCAIPCIVVQPGYKIIEGLCPVFFCKLLSGVAGIGIDDDRTK